MKVERMGIREILRRIWLFSANKIKDSESFSKQPTQLISELNSSLPQVIVTIDSEKLNQNSRKLAQWQLPVIGSLAATKINYNAKTDLSVTSTILRSTHRGCFKCQKSARNKFT